MTKSAVGKFWQKKSLNENFVSELSKNLQISDFLARLLSNRVESAEEGFHFLEPRIRTLLPDPFHLLDMAKATRRILHAIEAKEKICIFADYDVDGATSSALIKNIFRELGVDVSIYVPDRISEGYGPSINAMHKIRSDGTKLLITVDCGSVAFEALEAAFAADLDVIVIDHHISLDELPKAIAVINPNRLDEQSSCKNLAAVGVAFLFCVAVISELKKINFFEKQKITPPNLMKQLDIVALGTVCDVMLLTGLNRAFVYQGIKVARARENIGYRTLCDIANLDEAINCYHLGFVLGPRINAGGRVGKSYLGANLLSSTCEIQARDIATQLDQYNNERKVIEMQMLEEAFQIAILQEDDPMLLISSDGWHQGVIGIIAGRLKEKYNKPVAVIAINGQEGKASCRSIHGIDLGSKIIEAKNRGLLIAGGGHAMAAGFTVAVSKLDDLKLYLNQAVARDLVGARAHLEEYYETELALSAVNIDLLSEIAKLEPYGNGNPAPIFKFSNVYVLKADILAGKHLKILFASSREGYSSKPLSAIAFNAVPSPIADVIMSPKSNKLSIFGTLKANIWQERTTVQLQLKDVIIDK
jgi:single-stranded-DNA-specific exonuclease